MSEYGWVAMEEKGPWHPAWDDPTIWREELEAVASCESDAEGEGKNAIWRGWHWWRKTRPLRAQICKRCLAAEAREE